MLREIGAVRRVLCKSARAGAAALALCVGLSAPSALAQDSADHPIAQGLVAFAEPGGEFESFFRGRFSFEIDRYGPVLDDSFVSTISNPGFTGFHAEVGGQEAGVPLAQVRVWADVFRLNGADGAEPQVMAAWAADRLQTYFDQDSEAELEVTPFSPISGANCGHEVYAAYARAKLRFSTRGEANGGRAVMFARAGDTIIWVRSNGYDNNSDVAPRVTRDDLVTLALKACQIVAAGTGRTEVVVGNLAFFDANPEYSSDKETLPEDWRPSDLVTASEERLGVATDGESRLILRVELSEPAAVAFEPASDMDGSITPLLEGEPVTFQGKHYAFALYRAPDRFDDASAANAPTSMMLPPPERLSGTLQVRSTSIRVLSESGEELASQELLLARPPVVLVHGLFSDPITTWVDTFDDQPSMVAVLERTGFLPFLVNYQKTNGSWDTDVSGTASGSWLSGTLPPSSFSDNRSVVWDSPLDTYTPEPDQTGWFTEAPIRAEQQIPDDIRIGGISEALEYYRDDLKIAATQATVIGHSMGGLLARVWASASYNPDYEAARNFFAGDIYRLMTLNTPHHGSEMPELRDALADATIEGEPWLAWARRSLVNSALNWFLDPEPGAISDLRPGSPALTRIGPTPIPSLAIATTADPGQYGDPQYDPLKLYNSLYALAGTVLFQNRPLLDRFVETRFYRWRNTAPPFRNETDWRGESPVLDDTEVDLDVYVGIIGESMDSAAYFWALRRDAEFENELLRTLQGVAKIPFGLMTSSMGNPEDLELIAPTTLTSQTLLGVDVSRFLDESKTADVPRSFMALVQDLIFHQDPRTDGVVKLTSQVGGAVAHEPVPSVIHSYSPWYYAVQSRVIRALKWQPELFDPEGFPEAGQLTPRFLPGRQFTEARIDGARAINWSGMVPAHAEQYLAIADDADAIVLVRPVNPDSSRLLAENAAAKGMNVKGKSANWGPQSGFIPVDQRFSKLWRMFREPNLRDSKIEEYDGQVAKSLNNEHPEHPGVTFAVGRELTITNHTGVSCDVLQDPSEADAEAAIAVRCGPGYFDWRNDEGDGAARFDPSQAMPAIDISADVIARLQPLTVLADPTQPHQPYLTADYDLLAIGFRDYDGTHGPPEAVVSAEFHKVRGVITDRQWQLVDRINRAVQDNACYISGRVTHHGPENQYPGSPYVDYPILVFDPRISDDKTDGIAYLVRQGPPGFRDLHLKRLFVEKIGERFNLWPNPVSEGWQWEKRRPFDEDRGYDPRDAANLLVYVGEAPEPPPRSFDLPPECGGRFASAGDADNAGTAEEPTQADEQESKAFAQSDAASTPQSDADDVGETQQAGGGDEATATELTLWNDVKDSGSVEELQIYLDLFPEGVFAPLADLRIRQLQQEAPVGDGSELTAAPPVQSLDRVYASRFGYGAEIIALSEGGYLVGGHVSPDGQESRSGPWIARMSSAGDIEWEKSLAPGMGGHVQGMHLLENGDILANWTETEDFEEYMKYVGRFDRKGNSVWRFSREGRYGASLSAPLPNGDIAAAFSLGSDSEKNEVVLLSEDGDVLWRRNDFVDQEHEIEQLVVSGDDILLFSSSRTSEDGDFATGGMLLTVLSERGEVTRQSALEIGEMRFLLTSVLEMDDGDLILTGAASNNDFDESRAVMMRLAPSGRMIWRDERHPNAINSAHRVERLPGDRLVVWGIEADRSELNRETRIRLYDLDGALLDEGLLKSEGNSTALWGGTLVGDGALASFGQQKPWGADYKQAKPWLFVYTRDDSARLGLPSP